MDNNSATEPKFRVNNLTLTLPNHATILHNLSLNIPAGQICSLIGPSGSGKSSLLRCLNRLYEPPPNTIYLDGEDITTMAVLPLRRRVGMLFQQAALFDNSVAENIAYGPHLAGQTLDAERRAELLQMVGLDSAIASQTAATLSGGQAQRVALARTLANKPDLLLLDEPTNSLDMTATQHVEETILRLRDQLGLTVVWVSHSLEQVERTADFIGLLVEGRIVQAGPPQAVLSDVQQHF